MINQYTIQLLVVTAALTMSGRKEQRSITAIFGPSSGTPLLHEAGSSQTGSLADCKRPLGTSNEPPAASGDGSTSIAAGSGDDTGISQPKRPCHRCQSGFDSTWPKAHPWLLCREDQGVL